MKKLISLALCAMLLALCAAGCADALPTQDRAGNPITIPEKVERVISLAPATTEILDAIGATDLLVAVDTQTPAYVEGLDDLPQFDMMAPDVEAIAALQPDIVYTSGMSYIEGDPYAALVNMGVCVIEIPSSNSIEAVEEDVIFTAECIGKKAEGEALVADMQAQIDELAAIGATITEKKTVFFEISALPYVYSCGKGTFIDDMISLIGAVNVMGDQEGWLSVTEESEVAANPDVILTSVNYIEDPVGEILGRAGWENVTAIANGDVYYIDNAASSLPNHNIIKAMKEMAVVIYPELYAEYAEAGEPAAEEPAA